MTPARLSYTLRAPDAEEVGYIPLLPLTLENAGKELSISGLLDTGAAVNVLPYSAGIQPGLDWASQSVTVQLSDNLSAVPTRIVIVTGMPAGFSSVRLAFAWAQTDSVPLILGRVNFFAEYDVCFYRSQLAFEVTPKSIQP